MHRENIIEQNIHFCPEPRIGWRSPGLNHTRVWSIDAFQRLSPSVASVVVESSQLAPINLSQRVLVHPIDESLVKTLSAESAARYASCQLQENWSPVSSANSKYLKWFHLRGCWCSSRNSHRNTPSGMHIGITEAASSRSGHLHKNYFNSDLFSFRRSGPKLRENECASYVSRYVNKRRTATRTLRWHGIKFMWITIIFPVGTSFCTDRSDANYNLFSKQVTEYVQLERLLSNHN